MAKIKKAFFCTNCGNESPKWIGRCPGCNEWNTYVEEIISKENSNPNQSTFKDFSVKTKPVKLEEVKQNDISRFYSDDPEFNRVLGGGIVPGSIVLIGGEPGIGKSTLLLQIALSLKDLKILYVSGEESVEQIKMRADRIQAKNENLYLFSETCTQTIFDQVKSLEPNLIIIDSIQTVYSQHILSASGSISQVRECAGEFQRLAKETNIPVILIGHINKEGEIAGPKLLEHIVDTVLQFEGDRNYTHRLLRTIKNRFGSALELGVYEMKSDGLQPVINPSDILLGNRDEALSGVAIASTMEGMRPLMIEVQALVANAVYGNPQRSSIGFDTRRLNMLLAILEKRGGFQLSNKDVFLNLAGGIKVSDPALDLAVLAAIISSYKDEEISSNTAFCAEVGLSGEIRAVSRIEQRIAEAEKLGFEKIFISKYNAKLPKDKFTIKIVQVGKISEVYGVLF
ncbi:MAG: DNA repair protein RadA [Chitinophagales bacterium]|nr:DNA repair protein RadA [Chitinophagales bacterium]